MNAAANGHQTTVALLLAHSEIQVNLVNKEGWSALMQASDGGHEDTVCLLLDVPNINTTTKDTDKGYTAMSLALAHGHTSIVRLLQEFELRRVTSSSWDLSLENVTYLSQFASGEPIDEEVESGSDTEGSDIFEDAEEYLGVEDKI
ncbi:hypothetical protein BKA70DRAFT_1293078 [Coprinopsis sp. MPI-PUGE-AT-0042]|nr:hypothetical protein BKA70DRAFT_1293078 [Coprinopsis sp. MPI-PUGE-AT-0042]